MKKYTGIVDKITYPTIKGWVFNKYSPQDEIDVSIIINNKKVELVRANLFRKGTKLHENHPTGRCGFQYILSLKLMEHGNNIIEVVVGDGSQKILNSRQEIFINIKNEIKTQKIFFMHIAKTAGTTVNKIMSDQFSQEKCINHIETLPWTDIHFFERYDYVSGHIPYQLFAKFQSLENIITTTILRNPIDQIVSHLKWLKYVGLNPSGEFFKSHPVAIQKVCKKIRMVDFSNLDSLAKYIKSFEKSEYILLDNLQVRYFIKDPFKQKIDAVDIVDALSSMEQFSVIGQNNQLADFFLKINKFGFNIIYNPDLKLNVNDNNFRINPKDSKIQEILYPFYKYDSILYNKIKDNES